MQSKLWSLFVLAIKTTSNRTADATALSFVAVIAETKIYHKSCLAAKNLLSTENNCHATQCRNTEE